jgi:hypothetical protein
MFGAVQKLPKRLRFLMDVSSSMSYFNYTDRRLDRMLASTVMVMEAFSGLEHKYAFEIIGHSGTPYTMYTTHHAPCTPCTMHHAPCTISAPYTMYTMHHAPYTHTLIHPYTGDSHHVPYCTHYAVLTIQVTPTTSPL